MVKSLAIVLRLSRYSSPRNMTPQENTLSSQLAVMLQALYLFTASDIAPTIVPNVSFGILGALSGPLLTTNEEPTALHIFMRTVPVTLFIWGNVLIFTISNQCSPKSVIEDQINKP